MSATSDGYRSDVAVMGPGGVMGLYECERCYALTRNPFAHESWHQREDEAKS